MEERRAIGRVGYSANAVIVVCDTQEKYYVHTENVSPLGMALRVPGGRKRDTGNRGAEVLGGCATVSV